MAKAQNSAAQQPERTEVRLAKAHTHKGKPCKAGDPIQVTAKQKAWLEQHGLIEGQEVTNG